MRDSYARFEAHGIKLYAVSYDDQKTLREFSDKQHIPYTLLSDIDSEVIRRYGILNTEISEDDALLVGIPFPGVYVADESGKVVSKFFHDTYKKRDSPETLIDAALGRIVLAEDTPRAGGGDDEVRITAAIHGGKGSIRQGILRKVVVRFELADGLHIYGEPVPEGMVSTRVSVSGPPGLTVLEPELPATETLHLEAMNIDLQVWSGTVDIAVPFYPRGELVSETRPLDADSAQIEIKVRYQACTDNECLLPRTETFSLDLPMDVIDIPALGMHMGHGQREGNYDARPGLRRLLWRKIRRNPLGFFKFILKSVRLELAARKRSHSAQ